MTSPIDWRLTRCLFSDQRYLVQGICSGLMCTCRHTAKTSSAARHPLRPGQPLSPGQLGLCGSTCMAKSALESHQFYGMASKAALRSDQHHASLARPTGPAPESRVSFAPRTTQGRTLVWAGFLARLQAWGGLWPSWASWILLYLKDFCFVYLKNIGPATLGEITPATAGGGLPPR